MSELDYAQLNEAAKAGDFEKVSVALGVNVDAVTCSVFETWCRTAFERSLTPAKVFAVIRGALLEEKRVVYERIVYDRRRTTHLLAMRIGESVTVGVATTWDSKKPAAAWPSLEGWKPKLENNVALVSAWAKTAGEGEPPDRLQLKVRADFRVADDGGDEQRFLDAISRAPDDDDLRRVYADWLDERGDVRGEFIRLQLAEAANPYGPGRKRMTQMLAASWGNFAGELAPWSNERCFSRGLVARVNMTPAAFVKNGEHVFSKYPVQTLHVNAPKFTEKQLEQVVSAPAISRVRHVSLAQLGPGAPRLPLAALAKGTRFDSLRGLHFMSCGFSGEDWSTLFMRLDAPLLEEVEFSFNHSHPALWLALATSPSLKNLKSIDEYVQYSLPGGGDGEFAKALRAMADQRPKLEKLILSQVYHLDDSSIAPLFAKSSVVQLRELDINGAKLTDETLRSWQRGGRFGELKSLTVRNALFTAKGIAKFLEALPPKLELLSLICFDKVLWTEDTLRELYEALLRVPETSKLKKVAVPHGEREGALWKKLNERFEVEE